MFGIAAIAVWGCLALLGEPVGLVGVEPGGPRLGYRQERVFDFGSGVRLPGGEGEDVHLFLHTPVPLGRCSAPAQSEPDLPQRPTPPGDPFQTPEAGVSELLEYIGQLRQLQPPEPFDPNQESLQQAFSGLVLVPGADG